MAGVLSVAAILSKKIPLLVGHAGSGPTPRQYGDKDLIQCRASLTIEC
jgi:hypothetical protein